MLEQDAPDQEDEILRSLRRIIRAVDLYSRQLMTRHGLTGPQLLCLRELDSRGPMPSGVLARLLSLSPATVCGILDRLEARGFVIRERQAADKRRIVVRLAAGGRRAVRQAPPSLQDGFLFKLRALSSEQQAQMNRTLKKLVRMMSADLEGPRSVTRGESVTVMTRPIAARGRDIRQPLSRPRREAGDRTTARRGAKQSRKP